MSKQGRTDQGPAHEVETQIDPTSKHPPIRNDVPVLSWQDVFPCVARSGQMPLILQSGLEALGIEAPADVPEVCDLRVRVLKAINQYRAPRDRIGTILAATALMAARSKDTSEILLLVEMTVKELE